MKSERTLPTIETVHETLDTITLVDYQNIPPEAQEWLHRNEDVPEVIWEKIKDLHSNITLVELLRKIRGAFEASRQGRDRQGPDSFEASRFTSFEEVIARGWDSCGIRARVFGTTLRKIGIPVKFIDGKRVGLEETTDHAWLEIYSPKRHTWIECDPGEGDFTQSAQNKRERVFHDWDELKLVHGK